MDSLFVAVDSTCYSSNSFCCVAFFWFLCLLSLHLCVYARALKILIYVQTVKWIKLPAVCMLYRTNGSISLRQALPPAYPPIPAGIPWCGLAWCGGSQGGCRAAPLTPITARWVEKNERETETEQYSKHFNLHNVILCTLLNAPIMCSSLTLRICHDLLTRFPVRRCFSSFSGRRGCVYCTCEK